MPSKFNWQAVTGNQNTYIKLSHQTANFRFKFRYSLRMYTCGYFYFLILYCNPFRLASSPAGKLWLELSIMKAFYPPGSIQYTITLYVRMQGWNFSLPPSNQLELMTETPLYYHVTWVPCDTFFFDKRRKVFLSFFLLPMLIFFFVVRIWLISAYVRIMHRSRLIISLSFSFHFRVPNVPWDPTRLSCPLAVFWIPSWNWRSRCK